MRFLLYLIVVSSLQATALAEYKPSLFTSLVVKDATPAKGAKAVRVDHNSFCGVAGIQAGDIIIQLDGKPVDSLERYVEVSRGVRRNDSIDMTILHDGNKIDLTVKRTVGRASRPTDTEALPTVEDSKTPESSSSAEEHFQMGLSYHLEGKWDLAIKEYEEAIRIKPDYADAHNNLGLSYGENGLYNLEIRQYEEAIRIKPDYALAYYNLGVSYAEKSLYDLAIRQYEEAIRIKPDYAEAHYKLGEAYGEEGQYKKAIRHVEQALRLKPDYPKARDLLRRLKNRR